MTTLAGSRLSSINNEGFYGEPEQDANSALTELDKGLRSIKVGEQCEAIVRFPRLFEKYPFPILINSAFLKLADVFRIGNNFLRLWVLKVTQQSEKHLDKILNVDECVKRIYTVIYSNDPEARALTLRTLGSIASIIPERKNVHHSIKDSFDSRDLVELEAAVYAADKFSKYSKEFAGSICNKIEEMIQKLSTPVEMKLKLIPILQNMHHDAETSAIVRKLCSELLSNYPAEDFIAVTLQTLTNLSAATMIDIPDQISLLVKHLEGDPRVGVKKFVLKEMKTLALKGAHLWEIDKIKSLGRFSCITGNHNLKCTSFEVLISLAKSSEAAMKLLSLSDDNFSVVDLCEENSYSENLHLASLAICLFTSLALHDYQVSSNDVMFNNAATAIECLLIVIASNSEPSKQEMTAIKKCLACAVKLCESNIEFCYCFIQTLGDLSTSAKVSGTVHIVLLDALCAIGNLTSKALTTFLPDLVSQLASLEYEDEVLKSKIVTKLCTLIFQAMKDLAWKQEDEDSVTAVVNKSLSWDTYKIGRQAARYGHHKIAAIIFVTLTKKVSLENHHFWLASLVKVSHAETSLNFQIDIPSLMDRLNYAIMYYMTGISSLKAATTPAHQMDFQCEFIRLRTEMLKAYLFLIQTCNILRLCPPPAIATSMATSSRDDLQKSGRICMQLRKASSDFHRLALRYKEFSQALFNADPITLKILQILQFNCLLTGHAIGCIVLREKNFPFHDLKSVQNQLLLPNLEVHSMAKASCEATQIVTEYLSSKQEAENITHKQIEALVKILHKILSISLSTPRYFFQTLQATSIKLAISPQQKGSDPIMIPNISNLAVKVEGIVQHNSNAGIFREVAQIQLNISSTLQSRAQNNIDIKVTGDMNNNMKQTVVPHNDYFSAQFLLSFPVAGLHSITVSTSLIDKDQEVWNTGPRSTISVKSFEDPTTVNKNSQASTHRQSFPQRF